MAGFNIQYLLPVSCTPMVYPTTLQEVQEGLLLYVPDPGSVKTVYEQLLEKDPNIAFPFWAKIWSSAIALSCFLQTEPEWVRGKRVLELGAGIGLPSFSVAKQAAEMIISDHASEAVALIAKNIQYQGLTNAQARRIDWNHFPAAIVADTVLLSDVNYAPDQFAALLKLIRKLLDRGTVIILATPQRITASPFAEALQPFIKRSFLQAVPDKEQEMDIRILILDPGY